MRFDVGYVQAYFGLLHLLGQDCEAELLNNPDDRQLLPCCREQGHSGDHHCVQTGFAWHTNCNYRKSMVWGAKGSGWQILPDSAYAEIFSRVLSEPRRWQINPTPGWRDGGWMLQASPALQNEQYTRYHVTGFTGELLVAAWRHAVEHHEKSQP